MTESSPRIASRSPFEDWPAGLDFGAGAGTAWFRPDAVMCIQTHGSRVDLAFAKAYVQAIRVVRDAERASIARAGGLRIYQDLRSLQVIDRDARLYFADATRADFGRWSLVCNKIELASRNPIVRVTIQLVAKLAVQMGLPPFQLSVDLTRELIRDQVHPASAGSEHAERHADYARRLARKT